eukprot:6917442-Prymnesium_polylepis.1
MSARRPTNHAHSLRRAVVLKAVVESGSPLDSHVEVRAVDLIDLVEDRLEGCVHCGPAVLDFVKHPEHCAVRDSIRQVGAWMLEQDFRRVAPAVDQHVERVHTRRDAFRVRHTACVTVCLGCGTQHLLDAFDVNELTGHLHLLLGDRLLLDAPDLLRLGDDLLDLRCDVRARHVLD